MPSAGTVDFLTKPVERTTLLDALQRALARGRLQRAARDETRRVRRRFASLTPGEREVFERVVAGMLNKRIRDALGIVELAVKVRRARLMAKLGGGSAAELGRLDERLRHLTD